jgi:hypothetical protein
VNQARSTRSAGAGSVAASESGSARVNQARSTRSAGAGSVAASESGSARVHQARSTRTGSVAASETESTSQAEGRLADTDTPDATSGGTSGSASKKRARSTQSAGTGSVAASETESTFETTPVSASERQAASNEQRPRLEQELSGVDPAPEMEPTLFLASERHADPTAGEASASDGTSTPRAKRSRTNTSNGNSPSQFGSYTSVATTAIAGAVSNASAIAGAVSRGFAYITNWGSNPGAPSAEPGCAEPREVSLKSFNPLILTAAAVFAFTPELITQSTPMQQESSNSGAYPFRYAQGDGRF